MLPYLRLGHSLGELGLPSPPGDAGGGPRAHGLAPDLVRLPGGQRVANPEESEVTRPDCGEGIIKRDVNLVSRKRQHLNKTDKA